MAPALSFAAFVGLMILAVELLGQTAALIAWGVFCALVVIGGWLSGPSV